MFDERVRETEEEDIATTTTTTTPTSTFARTKGEEVWRVAVRASYNNHVNIGARSREKGRAYGCLRSEADIGQSGDRG